MSTEEDKQPESGANESADMAEASAGRSGSPFVLAVEQATAERGVSIAEMCRQTGIGAAYWNLVAKGSRPPSSLPEAHLRQLARFMGVPYIQVLMLAELLDISDFVDTSDVDAMYERALMQMRLDPQWAACVPSPAESRNLTERTKVLIVMLYERAYGQTLLSKATMIKLV